MIRTFEQVAKSINLNISNEYSLLKIEENRFDQAIQELTKDLNISKGAYIQINEHLEVKLAKTSSTIYVKFSDLASEKLNKLYGR
ncbi:hypothetical protein DKE45_020315 (plasmid) [Acinetobacter pittii]|nr:hypothetical protein DKE45_020315 [Acinetobacter pittii]HAV6000021.1 hypothetical protein [Acinetobacter baumannii]